MIFGFAATAYGAVALCALRPLAGHFAWTLYRNALAAYPATNLGRKGPNGAEWLRAFFWAGTLLVAWPLVFVVVLAGHKLPKIGAEREARLRAREERLRDAERELGLVQR